MENAYTRYSFHGMKAYASQIKCVHSHSTVRGSKTEIVKSKKKFGWQRTDRQTERQTDRPNWKIWMQLAKTFEFVSYYKKKNCLFKALRQKTCKTGSSLLINRKVFKISRKTYSFSKSASIFASIDMQTWHILKNIDFFVFYRKNGDKWASSKPENDQQGALWSFPFSNDHSQLLN